MGEIALAIGYAALECPAAIEAFGVPVQVGREVADSIVESLSTLPPLYYSNPIRRAEILPTLLILAGAGVAKNRELLIKHVAPTVFSAYVQEEEKCLKGEVGGEAAHAGAHAQYALSARVPVERWQPMLQAIQGSLLENE
jgi:hypothetical protein